MRPAFLLPLALLPATLVVSGGEAPVASATEDYSAESAVVKALFEPENSIWLTGDTRDVRTPSEDSLVGSNPVVQELDDKVAAARETVTSADMAITSSETSAVVEKVEHTRSGADVLTEVTINWVYKDLGNGELSDAGMTNYYLVTMAHGPNGLEVGDVQMTTASEFGYEEWATDGEADIPSAGDSATGLNLSQDDALSKPEALQEDALETTAATTGTEVQASYNGSAFASYMRTWTDADHAASMNSSYPVFDNNCANFVSQALDKAGWQYEQGVNPKDMNNWAPDLWGPAGASYTWAGARYLHHYGLNRRQLDQLKYLYNARPGYQLFADWEPNGVINHALGVTGRTSSGVPRVSQKTPNRHNILVSTWLQYAHDQFGQIEMYGLKDYFTF